MKPIHICAVRWLQCGMDLHTITIGEMLEHLRQLSDPGEVERIALLALAHADENASHNSYLWMDSKWTADEAGRAAGLSSDGTAILRGIPISVKDCFDLAGSPTSCGTKFYRGLNGIAQHDSWLVEHLRRLGSVITGKTHLHPLAYGITGENTDFGDCLQPGYPDALTGGSSSGAAASVMEGSAMAAIGTDTGGSIRVPAALCGLAGYRASLGWGDWRGGAHLAESFDTFGWLFRDLVDAPLLGKVFEPVGLIEIAIDDAARQTKTMAVVDEAFLHDCEPAVLEGFRETVVELEQLGLAPTAIDVSWWSDSREIFAPIQASEAAKIHAGHYDAFEASIRDRLQWGASLSDDDIASLRRRLAVFREQMNALLAEHEFLLMPAAPVAKLPAGADHSQTRARLLRYTTPVSLAGMPAVTVPCLGSQRGTGVQLVAARGQDRQLLTLAKRIGEARHLQAGR
jgi:Asp-tRNA(Asn)/Glu-tRNA(Gln) amidotransferase A subunit family amidase